MDISKFVNFSKNVISWWCRSPGSVRNVEYFLDGMIGADCEITCSVLLLLLFIFGFCCLSYATHFFLFLTMWPPCTWSCVHSVQVRIHLNSNAFALTLCRAAPRKITFSTTVEYLSICSFWGNPWSLIKTGETSLVLVRD